jgi:hypothetical protein
MDNQLVPKSTKPTLFVDRVSVVTVLVPNRTSSTFFSPFAWTNAACFSGHLRKAMILSVA